MTIKNIFLASILTTSIGCTNLSDANKIETSQVLKKTNIVSKVSSNNKNQVQEILNSSKETQEVINKTIKSIGKIEYNNFKIFFGLKNDKEVYKKIKEISPEDSIVGDDALKNLYINYYSQNPDKMTPDIQYRWQSYNEMISYEDKTKWTKKFGTIKAGNIPNVFSKKYYYGYTGSEPYNDTFIDEALKDKIPFHIVGQKGNNSSISKIDGKYVLTFYIDGILQLATYVSPGNPNQRGAITTPTGNFDQDSSVMYYISGAPASIKHNRGAVMPYAVHITGGVYTHAGSTTGDKASHGCVRLPLYYARAYYNAFWKIWRYKIVYQRYR